MKAKEGNKLIAKFMRLPVVEWRVGTLDGIEYDQEVEQPFLEKALS